MDPGQKMTLAEKRAADERKVRAELGKMQMMSRIPEIRAQVTEELGGGFENFLYASQKVTELEQKLEAAAAAEDSRSRFLVGAEKIPRKFKAGSPAGLASPNTSAADLQNLQPEARKSTGSRTGAVIDSQEVLVGSTKDDQTEQGQPRQSQTLGQRLSSIKSRASLSSLPDLMKNANAEDERLRKEAADKEAEKMRHDATGLNQFKTATSDDVWLPGQFLGTGENGLEPSAPMELRIEVGKLIDYPIVHSAVVDLYPTTALIHPTGSVAPKLQLVPECFLIAGGAWGALKPTVRSSSGMASLPTRWFLLPFYSLENPVPLPGVMDILKIIGKSFFIHLIAGTIIDPILPDLQDEESFTEFEHHCHVGGVFIFFAVDPADGITREINKVSLSSWNTVVELVEPSHWQFLLKHCNGEFSLEFGARQMGGDGIDPTNIIKSTRTNSPSNSRPGSPYGGAGGIRGTGRTRTGSRGIGGGSPASGASPENPFDKIRIANSPGAKKSSPRSSPRGPFGGDGVPVRLKKHSSAFYKGTAIVLLKRHDILPDLIKQTSLQGLYVSGIRTYYPESKEEVDAVPSVLRPHIEFPATLPARKGASPQASPRSKQEDATASMTSRSPYFNKEESSTTFGKRTSTNMGDDESATKSPRSPRKNGAESTRRRADYKKNLLIAFRGAESYERLCDIIGPAPDLARTTDPYSLNARFGGETRMEVAAAPPARGLCDIAWAFGGRIQSVQDLWAFTIRCQNASPVCASTIKTRGDLIEIVSDMLLGTFAKNPNRVDYVAMKNAPRGGLQAAESSQTVAFAAMKHNEPPICAHAIHVLEERAYSVALSRSLMEPMELIKTINSFAKLHEPTKLFSVVPVKLPLAKLSAFNKNTESQHLTDAQRKKADQRKMEQLMNVQTRNVGGVVKKPMGPTNFSTLIGSGIREGGIDLLPKDLGFLPLHLDYLVDFGMKAFQLPMNEFYSPPRPEDEMPEVCIGILSLGSRLLDHELVERMVKVCYGIQNVVGKPDEQPFGFGESLDLINFRLVNGAHFSSDIGANSDKMDDLNPRLWSFIQGLRKLFIVAAWKGENSINRVQDALAGMAIPNGSSPGSNGQRRLSAPSPSNVWSGGSQLQSSALARLPDSSGRVTSSITTSSRASSSRGSVSTDFTSNEWQFTMSMEESYYLYKIFFENMSKSSTGDDLTLSCIAPSYRETDLKFYGRYAFSWAFEAERNPTAHRTWDVRPLPLFMPLSNFDDSDIPESTVMKLVSGDGEVTRLVHGDQSTFLFCGEEHISRALMALTKKHHFVIEKLLLSTDKGLPPDWREFIYDQEIRDDFLFDSDRDLYKKHSEAKTAVILLSRRANACKKLQHLLGHADPRENKKRSHITLRRGPSRVECGMRCTSSAKSVQEFWNRWYSGMNSRGRKNPAEGLIEFCADFNQAKHFHLRMVQKADIATRMFVTYPVEASEEIEGCHTLAQILDQIGEFQDKHKGLEILITESANLSAPELLKSPSSHLDGTTLSVNIDSDARCFVIMVYFGPPKEDESALPRMNSKEDVTPMGIMEKLQEKILKTTFVTPIFRSTEKTPFDPHFFK